MGDADELRRYEELIGGDPQNLADAMTAYGQDDYDRTDLEFLDELRDTPERT